MIHTKENTETSTPDKQNDQQKNKPDNIEKIKGKVPEMQQIYH